MNGRVLATRLIMKSLPDEEYTRNGIIIPGVGNEKPGRAEVVVAGPNCFSKPGEQVLYNRGAAVSIDLEDGTYITMVENEHNILVIL